ncbi:MAG: hypothetical protein N3E45_13075 [Oscillatoriaceae bacterium SKW80]|nr:hypothetical protein [Oscillatoriaceae bacterium SKYG93]MCX8121733.1 hypothetical protein [Oscillatoriaceae bacterium SKW80]MDW8453651.1 hypothetical protein [Oscillatoriaceae cyanobacterium SKYGB_i_bin93]HIK28716.1 hypothetical protein [Oscillatoriaceae cyanobacterium M7585_C2015_266]
MLKLGHYGLGGSDDSNISEVIIIGVHISGLIACDSEKRLFSVSSLKKYFPGQQVRNYIRKSIEKAKADPVFQVSSTKKIRVYVSQRIGMAIKSGNIDFIYGLKEFLEEIRQETDTVTIIGRSVKEDEILKI